MRLFFLSPWPAGDPLSLATVEAHLKALAGDQRVRSIDYFSIERFGCQQPHGHVTPKADFHIQRHPIPPSRSSLPGLGRLRQHRGIKRVLRDVAQVRHPDLVICRGTTGIFGDILSRHLNIPYVVESFEPHAHYMQQTGTWPRWDPRFLVQRRWEERVKRSATALITVSHSYSRHLQQQEGIQCNRLHTVPCWVDGGRFRIDPEARSRLRRELGIGSRLALVYAGKFGGIYSPLADLAILRQLQEGFGQPVFVMVLTSADAASVREQLLSSGFSSHQFYVACVPHDQVNAYLNAADLALSFINSGPWSFACSAIKHGEYWACGLPVLMPPGVGDEAAWLEAEAAGAIASFDQPQQLQSAVQKLRLILQHPGHRERIRALALRERGPEPMRHTYQRLLTRFAPA
jgi:glycosyltransferase involved in cell wall biosynthesis